MYYEHCCGSIVEAIMHTVALIFLTIFCHVLRIILFCMYVCVCKKKYIIYCCTKRTVFHDLYMILNILLSFNLHENNLQQHKDSVKKKQTKKLNRKKMQLSF